MPNTMMPSLLVLLVLGVVTAIALPQFSQLTLRNGGTKSGQRAFCNPACPRIYLPVCGNDGKTYPNNCALQYYSCTFRNVSYAYMGECADGGRGQRSCPVICPYLYAPVCGSDGNTYPNICSLNAAACKDTSITLRYHRACENIEQGQQACPTTCSFDYAPVCGNDGNTYANLCTFQSSACTDSSLLLVANRPCTNGAY